MTTAARIAAACDEIKGILVEKNAAYGDSALDPVRIFSKADSREQLLVRLDDKLSRIARGGDLGEDVVLDLIGYLVLLRVHDRVVDDLVYPTLSDAARRANRSNPSWSDPLDDVPPEPVKLSPEDLAELRRDYNRQIFPPAPEVSSSVSWADPEFIARPPRRAFDERAVTYSDWLSDLAAGKRCRSWRCTDPACEVCP